MSLSSLTYRFKPCLFKYIIITHFMLMLKFITLKGKVLPSFSPNTIGIGLYSSLLPSLYNLYFLILTVFFLLYSWSG